MKPKAHTLTAIAALALAGGALMLAPGRLPVMNAEAASPTADIVAPVIRTVLVDVVHFETAGTTHGLPGTIAPVAVSRLSFRVGGKVTERLVDVGDRVHAGDPIAHLDDTDLRLKRDAALAELDAARIALKTRETDLARVKSLESGGWASNRAADDETVAVEEARARLLIAERNADLARNQLSYATLRADADGVVTEALVEPGQVVTAVQPIVEIAHDGAREAVVAIPESLLAGLAENTAAVELWSRTGHRVPARLRELSPVADPSTRTFEARFALEGADESAALGMSATVWLSHPADRATAELPLSAVLFAPLGPVVWAVRPDGTVINRPVDIAAFGTGTVRVSSGLAEGERIVVLGAHKLIAGEQVRPVAEGV